jgi:peroxiredoxin
MGPTHDLNVGDEAPDFCIPMTRSVDGQQGKSQVCLHDFRGKKAVILEFYGSAFTPR